MWLEGRAADGNVQKILHLTDLFFSPPPSRCVAVSFRLPTSYTHLHLYGLLLFWRDLVTTGTKEGGGGTGEG